MYSNYGDMYSNYGDMYSNYGDIYSNYGDIYSNYGDIYSSYGDIYSNYGDNLYMCCLRQEALSAAITEKDAHIALLEIAPNKKTENINAVDRLTFEKIKLQQQLKDLVRNIS